MEVVLQTDTKWPCGSGHLPNTNPDLIFVFYQWGLQDDDFPPRDDFSDADQLRVGNDGIFMLAFFSEFLGLITSCLGSTFLQSEHVLFFLSKSIKQKQPNWRKSHLIWSVVVFAAP